MYFCRIQQDPSLAVRASFRNIYVASLMSTRRRGGLRGSFQINREWQNYYGDARREERGGMGVKGVNGSSCLCLTAPRVTYLTKGFFKYPSAADFSGKSSLRVRIIFHPEHHCVSKQECKLRSYRTPTQTRLLSSDSESDSSQEYWHY